MAAWDQVEPNLCSGLSEPSRFKKAEKKNYSTNLSFDGDFTYLAPLWFVIRSTGLTIFYQLLFVQSDSDKEEFIKGLSE